MRAICKLVNDLELGNSVDGLERSKYSQYPQRLHRAQVLPGAAVPTNTLARWTSG